MVILIFQFSFYELHENYSIQIQKMFKIFENDDVKRKNMKKERAIIKITIMLIGMFAFISLIQLIIIENNLFLILVGFTIIWYIMF